MSASTCRPRSCSSDYDAVALTGGAEKPRDLPIPGRDLDGIHFAMDFLPQQNRRVSGEPLGNVKPILAGGKHVVVIGGGDTGSDCIGTSIRQGALSVTQLRDHAAAAGEGEQGADLAGLAAEAAHLVEPRGRRRARLRGADAEVHRRERPGEEAALRARRRQDASRSPGTEFEIKADLVLLAMGFVHPVHDGMIKSLGVDARPARQRQGRHRATTRPRCAKVFAAGDMRRGQSLVVWAIREGRQCAHAIDKFLMGTTTLPR